jgi:hypothetical protein
MHQSISALSANNHMENVTSTCAHRHTDDSTTSASLPNDMPPVVSRHTLWRIVVSRESPQMTRASSSSRVCSPISRFRLTADLSGRARRHSMRDLTASQCRSAARLGLLAQTWPESSRARGACVMVCAVRGGPLLPNMIASRGDGLVRETGL